MNRLIRDSTVGKDNVWCVDGDQSVIARGSAKLWIFWSIAEESNVLE